MSQSCAKGRCRRATRRCGKPRCHCAQEGDPGHGPYWSVTRAVHGKTQFRSIAPDAVRQTEEQIAEFHRFQRLTREFVDVSTRLCDAQLEAGGSGRAGEKGGLETTLTAEVSAEAERLIGEGALDDFQAFETEARRVALQLMGQAVARRLNADHGDDKGPRVSAVPKMHVDGRYEDAVSFQASSSPSL